MGKPCGVELVALHYPFSNPRAARIIQKDMDIEQYSTFLKYSGINQVELICHDLAFLNHLHFINHLRIKLSSMVTGNVDFTPLYNMPELLSLSCQNAYGPKLNHFAVIDYSKVNGLVDLFVSVNKGTLNFGKVQSLKTLIITRFTGNNYDLTDMFCSTQLDTLEMIQCGVRSLKGIGLSSKMQCVYLSYNRKLKDISALADVRDTLKALRIANCSQIEDFSVLEQLDNLELLELTGSNILPNLAFLRKMKNLKTFVFDMNVLDGDLTPCLGLSYVYSAKNRRHYNLRDIDLPKGRYFRGNEDIEEWRRLE